MFKHHPVVVATALALSCSAASGFEAAVELNASVGNSDNIASVPTDETSETIQTVGLAFVLTEDSPKTTIDIAGNALFYRYVDGTFDEELIGGASVSVVRTLVPERFFWNLDDDFGQQIIDPLRAATPINREDINIFRTGPEYVLPLGDRTAMRLDGRYSKITYAETSVVDNARRRAQLTFERTIGPRAVADIGFNAEDIDFDLFDNDLKRRQVYIGANLTGARSSFVARVGVNDFSSEEESESEPESEDEGLLFDLAFSRQVGRRGTLNLEVEHGFSDSGDIFGFGQGIDRDFTVTQDAITTPDVMELDSLAVSYDVQSVRTSWSLRMFHVDENYVTEDHIDRKRDGLRFGMMRSFSSRWRLFLRGRVTRRDFYELNRVDDDKIASLEISRRLGGAAEIGFRVEQFTRESDEPLAEYEENRVFVTFRFRPVGRANMGLEPDLAR